MDDIPITLVGLDFETTGIDTRTLRPLQIGVYIEDELEYSEYLRYENYAVLLEGNASYQEAASIHQIPPEKIIRAEKTIRQVDIELHRLLAPRITTEVLVATGFSVHFDLDILKRHFPSTANLFSHRIMDPNSLFIPEARKLGGQGVLKRSKEVHKDLVVKTMMDGEWNEHDALWDAKFAVKTVRLHEQLME